MADNQMRGQIRVANDVTRQSSGEVNISPLPSAGIEQALGQVSDVFAGIGNRIGQMADKAAQREGSEAGLVAGLDPEFRTMRTHTIRGDAFDKAGLDVAETRIRQQLEGAFDAAFLKHGNDAAKLQSVLGATQAGILMHAPAELRPGIVQLANGKRLAFSREQARKAAAEAAAEAEAAAQQQAEDILKGMHQRAYASGLDGEADTMLANDAAALTKTLGRRAPDGSRLFSPAQAAKLLDGVKETVATARLTGAFSRLPTLDAKEKFIKEFEADFAHSRGLAKVYDLNGFERTRGHLEGDLRAARAEHNIMTRALGDEVKGVAKMAEKGFAPSPAELSALKTRVLTAADPDTSAALALAEDTIGWQSAARRSSPAELDTYVQKETARLKANGATPQAVARLEMAEGLLGEMRKEVKTDPLGWADRVGLVKLAPLDQSSPDALGVTLKARMAQAEEISQFYGQSPKYLRPDEKAALANAAAQGGRQTIAISQALAEAAGKRAPEVMAEIFDEAPTVAMLGGHVSLAGVTTVARDAADGMALIKTEGFKGLAPPAAAARTEAINAAGTALQAMPKAEAAAISLANAAYEVRARRLGLTEFDANVWQQGFREVLGERTIGEETFGGVVSQNEGWISNAPPVVIPPNVKQQGFRELIDALRLDDLVAANGAPLDEAGRPMAMTTVQRSRLVSVGDGKYWLATGDVEGGDPRWIKGAGDEPYVLDLRALEPVLKKRRPDLYLGGQ
ncbi:MAG: hypothetical protein ACRCS9_08755 [Hyphomicrobium sp.]